MEKLILDFLEYLEFQKNYSKYTIINYSNDLKVFNQYLKEEKINVSNITYETIRLYLRYLNKFNYSSRTISRHISALRSLFKYLYHIKSIDNDPMVLISTPKLEKKLPKYLEYEEIENLLSKPDKKTTEGLRDALIMELLYSTGIRVSELVNIKFNDISLSNKEIRILGKGNKERIVLFGNVCLNLLNEYLNNIYQKINVNNSNYILLNQHGNRISDREIRTIINKYASLAGIKKTISPHTLRHTFATHMLNSGSDIKTVGDLLGHETIRTTTIYTHVTNEQLKKVYLSAHPRAKKKD